MVDIKIYFVTRTDYSFRIVEVDQATIDTVMALLGKEGFDCYQTSVGGPGVRAVSLDASEDLAWMSRADMETLEQKFL